MWEKYSFHQSTNQPQPNGIEVEIKVSSLKLVTDPEFNSETVADLDYLRELNTFPPFVFARYVDRPFPVPGSEFNFINEGHLPLEDGEFLAHPVLELQGNLVTHEVYYRDGNEIMNIGIAHVDALLSRARDWESTHEVIKPLSMASLVAYLSAEGLGFNLFVTDADFLLSNYQLGKTFAVSLPDAMAFGGLTMRMRGETILWASNNALHTATNDWTYFLESRYLFEPIARRAIRDETQSPYFNLLLGAVQRGQQLLRLRDELVVFQFSSKDTYLTDPIFTFESFWIYTSGIFDCISQALNIAFSLGVEKQFAKFRNQKFKKALTNCLPEIHEFLEQKGIYSLIKIISELRNTIHEEPSSLTTVLHNQNEYFVMVSAEVSTLLNEFRVQFNLGAGIGAQDTDGRLHLRPIAFVEILLPQIIHQLNSLVEIAHWPRDFAPPPAFSTNAADRLFIGSAERNHALFGINRTPVLGG